MKCKFCGKEVEESAIFCGNCGKNLKEKEKPNGCLTAIFCVIGFFLFLIFIGSVTPETPIAESDDSQKSSAKYYCHEYAKTTLKNPRDAEFASFSDVKFIKIENMNWWVTSYVYATNSFGAKIKSTFTCEVELIDNEHGRVKDFTISEF